MQEKINKTEQRCLTSYRPLQYIKLIQSVILLILFTKTCLSDINQWLNLI